MNTLAASKVKPAAIDVKFEASKMFVHLSDGREIGVPLEWFPRLREASSEQLHNWRLIGRGTGIHWPDVDEDISVEGLLRGVR